MADVMSPWNANALRNPIDGFAKAYDVGSGIRQDVARGRAGNALRDGGYDAAAGELLGAGDVEGGARLRYYGAQAQNLTADNARADEKAKREAEEQGLKYSADFATRLSSFHAQHKDLNRTLAAFDAEAPRLQQLAQETPEEIAALRQHLQTDPEGTLAMLGAAAKKYQLANGGDGYLGRFDPDGGSLETLREGQPKPLEIDPEKNYYLPEPRGGAPAPDAPDATPPAVPRVAPTSEAGEIDPEAVWRSIRQQESGGDPTPGDAVGPDTRYGNALGSTQMLPATAEAMARKLGIAWNPALMRENSPRALEYQDKLGRAYFEEGLERSGGDPAAAAAYYFAGPNEELHGPKTRTYVQQVMARAGAAGAPYEVAGNGDPPALSGYRLLQQGRPKPKPTARPATAAEKAAYGVGPDVPAQIRPDGTFDVITGTGATLKKVPAQVQSGYVDNRKSISQIDAAIAAIKNNPGHLGLRSKLGDDINQRIDPNGVPVRAAVANIGSLLIHDRSGAAVTAAEQPRLLPFIPSVSDTDEAAIKKLMLLKEQYGAANSEIETVFGADAGYSPMGGAQAPAGSGGEPKGARKDPAALAAAKAAIQKGAPRAAVIQRLREHGIDPAGL